MDYDIQNILDSSISYEDYFDQVALMVKEGRTSGPIQSEAMNNYTKLNLSRMKRLNKTATISSDLVKLIENSGRSMKWLVITEAWCGDAAQNIPYMAKLADELSKVDLRLVYRDEHPKLMNDYLTNGSKSIPKLIVLDAEKLYPLAVWGPRPQEVQKMVIEYRDRLDPKPTYDEFSVKVQQWYNENKNQTLESELFSIFRKINQVTLAS